MRIIDHDSQSYWKEIEKFLKSELSKVDQYRFERELIKIKDLTLNEALSQGRIKRIQGWPKLYELRIRFRTNNLRVFAGIKDETIFPLHIIKKKSDGISVRELEKAHNRLNKLKF